MATSAQALDLVFKAAGDLSAKQYYIMKFSAARTVTTCTAATDVPCGVLQNKPAAADRAAVVRSHGSTKVVVDAALSAGDIFGTSADGQADAKTVGTDTTEYVLGLMVDAPGTAGDIAEGIISVPAFRAA